MEFRIFFNFGDFFDSVECFSESWFDVLHNLCCNNDNLFFKAFVRDNELVNAVYLDPDCHIKVAECIFERYVPKGV